MNTVIFSLSFAIAGAVVFLSARHFDRRILGVFALSGAVYLGADDFVTGAPSMISGLDVLGGHWNWTGKLSSLVLSALVITALRLAPATVGLKFTQRHTRIGLVALALFVVWGTCLGLLFRPGEPDAETLAFQAFMPGLSD